MKRDPARLPILKTYKLFIGGKFPRSESGRYKTMQTPDGQHLANHSLASRKDLRDAVRAARTAQPAWAALSPYLRGQILYRVAEMLESRRPSFLHELRDAGSSESQATAELDCAIDRLVHYAGWSDKLSSVFGSCNPVASPHLNVSVPEPSGVVALLSPDSPSLAGLATLLAAAIVSGNTAVALTSTSQPLPSLSFAESFATGDVPAGVVNILSGDRAELAPLIASHMDINAVVDGSGDPKTGALLQEGAAHNLKRVHLLHHPPKVWLSPALESPYLILHTTDLKTTWHPAGY